MKNAIWNLWCVQKRQVHYYPQGAWGVLTPKLLLPFCYHNKPKQAVSEWKIQNYYSLSRDTGGFLRLKIRNFEV